MSRFAEVLRHASRHARMTARAAHLVAGQLAQAAVDPLLGVLRMAHVLTRITVRFLGLLDAPVRRAGPSISSEFGHVHLQP